MLTIVSDCVHRTQYDLPVPDESIGSFFVHQKHGRKFGNYTQYARRSKRFKKNSGGEFDLVRY